MWLITGFAPFGGQNINPSFEAVRRLPDTLCGEQLIKAELPVAWQDTAEELLRLIGQYDPDGVLLIGQAGGREAVTPERVAINLCEAAAADNNGVVRFGDPVAEDGPAAYFATVDVHAMVEKMKEEGIPAKCSYTAGAYLCNLSMYTALHHAAKGKGFPAGFVHVPYMEGQDEKAFCMPMDTIARAVEICVATAIEKSK